MDIKARLKNKYFWLAFISLIVTVVKEFKPEIIPANLNDTVTTILGLLVTMGILVDHSTPGLTDSTKVQD
jgi:phi LC3 family holin